MSYYVSSGMVYSGIYLDNEVMNVSSGGTAINTTVNSGGSLCFFGGVANNVTVNPGGYLEVYEGTVNNILWTPCEGHVYVSDWGRVSFVSQYSGVYYGSDNRLLSNAMIMNFRSIYSSYEMFLMSGGTVNSTNVNSDGNLYVFDGGTANSTTITSGGFMSINSGGTANSTTVNSDGRLIVSSGGTVNSTTVNSEGWLHVSSGGTATNIIWTPCVGNLRIRNGASVTFASKYSGVYFGSDNQILSHAMAMENESVFDYNTSMCVMSGGRANYITVDGGGLEIYSGGTAQSTIITFGWLDVSSGGTANSTTVCGLLHVYDGGTANNTTVNSYGSLSVLSGGTANSTTITSGGFLRIDEGGMANSTTVTSGGSLRIDEGGTATNVFWTPCVGKVGYEDGAKVTFASSYSGVYFGFDNQLLSHAAVLNDQTVSGWGCSMYVMSGGTANRATIDDGGWLQVYSGGTANSATIKCGYLDVFSGGVANNVTINNSDSYSILDICSGGTANSVTVNDGGWLDLESGGGVNSATVTSGGSLRIFGGRLTGQTTISSGGYVYIDSGAKLDFDISSLAPGATARINDLSLLSGWTGAVFTLTVDGNQTNGTYRLAENAAGFNKTISVVNASCTELGTLAVGQTTSIGGVYYTLKLNSGSLTVAVSGGSPEPGPVLVPEKLQFFTGDFIGNGKSMLAVKDGNAIRIYRNKGTVLSELTLDDGWAVAGVGDFDCDGADDILRVHASGLVIGEMSDGDGEFSPQVLNFRSDGWSILGTGDFNGNGKDDVLIANPTGASDTVGLLGYWESGVTWTLINGYSAEWKCVATGDFNGDGKCDMLWRNSFVGDGGGTFNAYCTWIVDPPAGQSDWRMVSVANPSEWNFLCSGDFDGNGSHDIAMINDVGVVGIWGVTDGYLNSWSILSAVDPSVWALAGVGDFNGDGTDDIAWSNTDTGLTGYWQINDKELTTWANLAMIG